MQKLHPLYEHFMPYLFTSETELIKEAKDLEIEFYKDLSLIGCLVRTAGELCRITKYRLFYLKCTYSKELIEDLKNFGFRNSPIKENTFINGNDFHGSLFVVEAIGDIGSICKKAKGSSFCKTVREIQHIYIKQNNLRLQVHALENNCSEIKELEELGFKILYALYPNTITLINLGILVDKPYAIEVINGKLVTRKELHQVISEEDIEAIKKILKITEYEQW